MPIITWVGKTIKRLGENVLFFVSLPLAVINELAGLPPVFGGRVGPKIMRMGLFRSEAEAEYKQESERTALKAVFRHGLDAALHHDYDAALSDWERLRDPLPESVVVHSNIACMHYELKHRPAASSMLRHAAECYPKQASKFSSMESWQVKDALNHNKRVIG